MGLQFALTRGINIFCCLVPVAHDVSETGCLHWGQRLTPPSRHSRDELSASFRNVLPKQKRGKCPKRMSVQQHTISAGASQDCF
jgi:hypothetical protein